MEAIYVIRKRKTHMGRSARFAGRQGGVFHPPRLVFVAVAVSDKSESRKP
jgi:hypothetical protein